MVLQVWFNGLKQVYKVEKMTACLQYEDGFFFAKVEKYYKLFRYVILDCSTNV